MYKPNTWLKPRSEPYLQPELGWTHQRVTNLPRYFYGYQWRHMGFEEFLTSGAHPGKRKPPVSGEEPSQTRQGRATRS